MSPNPFAKLVQSPLKPAMKQLQQYVSEYAGAVDGLRVAGAGRGDYTDAHRARDMQKLVNAAEKIKMLDLSEKEFEKGLQGLPSDQKAIFRAYYNHDYLEIKNGNMSPQKLFQELHIKLPVPEPILDDSVLMKKLQSVVSAYNAAENKLRVGEFTSSYTDTERAQDLQKLVNAAEQVKRLQSWIPEQQFKNAIAAIPDADNKRMFNIYLSDMGKIASGEKNPSKLVNDLGIKLPLPTHNVPMSPPPTQLKAEAPKVTEPQPEKPEEPKKEGFFSRLKNKISDLASGFANYMKEHPVRGGLLIAGAVLGIGIIVAASVFTGGAAGAAAVGGFAALMGTGGSALVSGVLFGTAVTASSAIALAYDVNKEITKEQAHANLHARLAAANATPPMPEQPKGEPTKPAWKCGVKPAHEDLLHNINNGEKIEANKAATLESKENLHASKGPIAPTIDNLADDVESEEDTEHPRM